MWIARTLVLIGALNWGLIGFFRFDLVAALFGPMTMTTRVVYDVIGLAAVAEAIGFGARRTRRAD